MEKKNKAEDVNQNTEEAQLVVDKKNPLIFVGWDLVPRHGTGYRVKDVIEKMDELGLPPEAGDIRSKSAITRALREAAKGQDLRILVDNDDQMLFQLTKISVEDDARYGKIAKYLDETHIKFDKKTDDDAKMIVCDNKKIKTFITEKFLVCKEHYRTNDITRILLRLFAKHSDIILIRKKGGAYMVPSAYADLVGKVKTFIKSLTKRNRTTIFKVSAEESGDLKPIFEEVKKAELKAFRAELKAMEEEDANKAENKSCESKQKRDNRKAKLAEMRKKITLWCQSLQYESEELNDLMRKCEIRVKKFFGAVVDEAPKKKKKVTAPPAEEAPKKKVAAPPAEAPKKKKRKIVRS
jgi:hypothetical protein